MLALLGVIALIQALFLPGFVLGRLLGVRGAWRTMTTAFGLSLVVNAFLVAALVALHLYTRATLLILFVLECALAFRLRSRDRIPGPPFAASWNALELVLLALVLGIAGDQAGRTVRAFGSIFSGWDDVVSWNRWAMDWYRGFLPRHTWHYPQLLPEAWSVTYAFLGTERIQFFARGMMGLFGLAAVAAVADLARPPARVAFLASALFAGLFLGRFNNTTAGLADIPVAFFALAAIVELLRPGDESRTRVGVVLAAGAAITKQAGLYLVLVYPLLGLAIQGRRAWPVWKILKTYALLAALALPWYVYKQIDIARGGDVSEVHAVTQLTHHGLSLSARLAHGVTEVAKLAGGPAVLAAIFALLLLGFVDRRARWILALVGIPYMLIWGLWFSYDVRNASLGLGACAIGCGAGLSILAARVPFPSFAIRLPSRPHLDAKAGVALAVLALVIVAFAFPDQALLARQDRLQRGLGDPAFNDSLYARAASGFTRKILADDQFLLAYTPGWDSTFVLVRMEDYKAFTDDAARPEVGYVIVPADPDPGLEGILSEWKLAGRFRETFRAGRHVFLTRAAP